jgi:hypothetical protein
MLREPQHGSWLNMAESEIGVLASQCLDRRIIDKQILAHEVNATSPRQGQLAIQNRRRPRQAEETVPSVRVTRATSGFRDPTYSWSVRGLLWCVDAAHRNAPSVGQLGRLGRGPNGFPVETGLCIHTVSTRDGRHPSNTRRSPSRRRAPARATRLRRAGCRW